MNELQLIFGKLQKNILPWWMTVQRGENGFLSISAPESLNPSLPAIVMVNKHMLNPLKIYLLQLNIYSNIY